jgi:hypothetical protein
LRSIIDPSLAPDRAPPRDERGLCLAAKNASVLALDNNGCSHSTIMGAPLDNVSGIPPWLSDRMCHISTCTGISDLVLYTNNEAVIYFLRRPQIFTPIPRAAVRGNLVSHLISITLPG